MDSIQAFISLSATHAAISFLLVHAFKLKLVACLRARDLEKVAESTNSAVKKKSTPLVLITAIINNVS